MATALRWFATTSCSSRAILARSALTACRRSNSTSRAVCSARARSAAAWSRYCRTLMPVSTGNSPASTTSTPSAAPRHWPYASTPTTTPTRLSATVIRSNHRHSRGGPYTQAS
ncbi:hypothetical protein PSN01_02999 [Micromonospora saelicesensis]|nr:hypothetical protein PSN01_02999 [Micromonospora saelicesensis]